MASLRTLVLCTALFVAALTGLRAQPVSIPTTYSYSHDMAPRKQWNTNYGYCGETAFIMAGMKFGQYCSQYTARSIAAGPFAKQYDESSQLLLGVNDVPTARKMRLQASEFFYLNQGNTKQFLAWVKSHTLAGHVVVLGVFNNGIALDEWTSRKDGDEEYDHIVPVMGWGSFASLEDYSADYFASDVITISDNGLYGPFGTPPAYQYLYSYYLKHFQGTRAKANSPNGSIYLLKNKPYNYAIAIEGIIDLDNETIPVTLTSNVNYEPEIAEGSNTLPTPIPIKLTATVTIPDNSKSYRLYRYDNFMNVPAANFDSMSGNAVQHWDIPAFAVQGKFTVTIDTTSEKTNVFRAVEHNNFITNEEKSPGN
jgi:hypothetical protein